MNIDRILQKLLYVGGGCLPAILVTLPDEYEMVCWTGSGRMDTVEPT